ncbi:MAG: protein kinase [Trueperaceae bacterium]|nr:protein kinase [Trueperaceae bacterium]
MSTSSPTTLCPHCGAPVALGASSCPACGGPLQRHLKTGHKLANGRYSVGRVLGQGGFGITYQGADTRLGRSVAIKELFPEGATRRGSQLVAPLSRGSGSFAEVKTRFTEEAQLLAQFNHPGIVAVLGVFEENQTAYIVMEFLRGETLAQRVQRGGPLMVGEGLELALRLADALDVVHQAGLLHRDIKPDNILLEDAGRAVLIDFGSARAYSQDQTVSHTRLVTPGYAPPEQYTSQARFGPYTDLYALAATLYHALSGQQPPPATDRLMGAELPPLPDSVPRPLSDALTRTLALPIAERPADVDAFVGLLPTAPRQKPQPPSATDDLAELIARTPDGGRLELPPGRYRLEHPLNIDRRLTLVGRSPDDTVVFGTHGPYLFAVGPGGVLSLQGITLRFEGTDAADVLRIHHGQGRLEHVVLRGGTLDLGRGGSGLLLTGRAEARLNRVTFQHNARHGLEASDDARLSLVDGDASDNRRCGLLLRGRVRGEIRDSRCSHNARHGADIGNQATLVLRGNRLEHNAQHGFCYRGTAGGRADDNQIDNNRLSGIALFDRAAPELVDNRLEHNGQYGLCYLGASGGQARHNRFAHNRRGDVAIARSVRQWHPEGGPGLEPPPPHIEEI